MVTQADINNFLKNPVNFLYGTDWREGNFHFIPAHRNALSELSFLDDRTLGQSRRKGILTFDQVAPFATSLAGKSDFIFHSAFCCSTLIARCLDVPGKTVSLKEPLALLNISGLLRSMRGTVTPDFLKFGEPTLKLLARPFSPGERVLIKPSNGCNNLLPEIFSVPGSGKVVLLYGTLDDFLVSIISGGEARQDYIDKILEYFLIDFTSGRDLPALEKMGPLEKAALVWGLQVERFASVYANGPKDRLMALPENDFLNNKPGTLSDISGFFDLGLENSEIETILKGPALNKHSKAIHRQYSENDRNEERKAILGSHSIQVKNAKLFLDGLDLKISNHHNPLKS